MTRTDRSAQPWSRLRLLPLASLCLIILLACESAISADGDDDDLIAKVGSVEITREEVEEQIAGELQRLEQQKFDLISRASDQAIERALIDLEAEAKGVTADELMASVIASIDPPTEDEISAFYESRKSQINRPLEDVHAQIVNYLTQQSRQGARAELVRELRGRYEVRRYLEPIRVKVAAGNGPAMGPEAAPVTIIEFSDFQCPYCQRLAPTLDRIAEDYADSVRLVFRQFPLPQLHADAEKAAEASLCAAEQDLFWEMHDAMFENIRALSVAELKEKATGLGMDAQVFADCLDSGRHAGQVADDVKAGREAGVSGTPAIFINGRFMSGAQPYEAIAAVIEDELDRAAEAGN